MRQFEAEMEAQRERARAGASFGGGAPTATASVEIYRQLSAQLPKPEFLGYTQLATPARDPRHGGEGRRLAARRGQGQTVEVILDRTPAYAESGGQMGDTGAIIGRDGQGAIEDTYYRGGQLIVHRVRVTEGHLRESRGGGGVRRVARGARGSGSTTRARTCSTRRSGGSSAPT